MSPFPESYGPNTSLLSTVRVTEDGVRFNFLNQFSSSELPMTVSVLPFRNTNQLIFVTFWFFQVVRLQSKDDMAHLKEQPQELCHGGRSSFRIFPLGLDQAPPYEVVVRQQLLLLRNLYVFPHNLLRRFSQISLLEFCLKLLSFSLA